MMIVAMILAVYVLEMIFILHKIIWEDIEGKYYTKKWNIKTRLLSIK